MTDEKEDFESRTQIDGKVGDNATNTIMGNNSTINQYVYINMPDGSSKLISKDDLSPEEQELLKAGYADGQGDGLIEIGAEQKPFLFIQTEHRRFVDIKYRSALKSLCEHKLVTPDLSRKKRHHKYYNLTSPGEKMAQGMQAEG